MTATALRIAYRLALTAEEYKSLAWLEARGYAASLIAEATRETWSDDGQSVTLEYTEPAAWNATDSGSNDDDGDDPDFGTCAGSSLLSKMFTFRDSIV